MPNKHATVWRRWRNSAAENKRAGDAQVSILRLESENSSLRQSHNLQVDTINAQAKRFAELEAK